MKNIRERVKDIMRRSIEYGYGSCDVNEDKMEDELVNLYNELLKEQDSYNTFINECNCGQPSCRICN